MSDDITPTRFREQSMKRARKDDTDLTYTQTRMALYALGITGEAGEVADEIRKVLYHGKPLDCAKLDRLLHEVGATTEEGS